MISYGSGGCGGCVRYIQRVEQPLYDPEAEWSPGADAEACGGPSEAHRARWVPVACVESGKVFPSTMHAAMWVVERLGLSKSVKAAASHISLVSSVGCDRTAYGFHWRKQGR